MCRHNARYGCAARDAGLVSTVMAAPYKTKKSRAERGFCRHKAYYLTLLAYMKFSILFSARLNQPCCKVRNFFHSV